MRRTDKITVPAAQYEFAFVDRDGRTYERTYHRDAYRLQYRIGLVPYSDVIMPGGGWRLSTAAEELAIQLYQRKPLNAKEFQDVLKPNRLQVTDTVLRAIPGWEGGKKQILPDSRKYSPRQVLERGRDIGYCWVPEGGSRSVPRGPRDEIWNRLAGIPRITNEGLVQSHDTCFDFGLRFEESDHFTGEFDLVVERGLHTQPLAKGRKVDFRPTKRWIGIYADSTPLDAAEAKIFARFGRLVKGRTPEIRKF